jgi:excisionase family DNA binding protein
MNAVEAAAYLRVSVSWIRKATRRKEVPSFQIGTRVLYDRADLDAYIAERKQEAAWQRLRGR